MAISCLIKYNWSFEPSSWPPVSDGLRCRGELNSSLAGEAEALFLE